MGPYVKNTLHSVHCKVLELNIIWIKVTGLRLRVVRQTCDANNIGKQRTCWNPVDYSV